MKCHVCNSSRLSLIFNLGEQPLANKYPKNNIDIRKEKKYSLKILFCKNCKASQISNLIDRKILFKEYFYLSSINLGLKKHFAELSKKLKKYKFVVDIGSNDGVLLEPLKKLNIKSIGIDPSVNVGKIANDRGLKTFVGFFDRKIINKVLRDYQKPDAIVASSVMTHLEKPRDFVRNIKYFLKENGVLILEIEYFYNFIKNLEYERFYFDRPFYYSANSIDKLFYDYGMSLFDIEIINTHGGSLRLYIKNKKNIKQTKNCKKILDNENNYLKIEMLKNIRKKINTETKIFKNKLKKYKKNKKIIIGYGAPARVSTITNYGKIGPSLISYIIDDSPLKQYRYTPGSHINIIPYNNKIIKKIDIVIVFAYEYFKDIKKKFKNLNVIFYKPIPFKKLR